MVVPALWCADGRWSRPLGRHGAIVGEGRSRSVTKQHQVLVTVALAVEPPLVSALILPSILVL